MNGLSDKTVVLVGAFGQLTQNLTARLAEYGANVCLVTDNLSAAERICQNLNDMREVSERFGRTAAMEIQIDTEAKINNIFSRAAELFGGIDIYIDTNLFSLEIPFSTQQKDTNIAQDFQKVFEKIKLTSAVAANFMKSRSRGRILFLYHELDKITGEEKGDDGFNLFLEFIHKKAIELTAQNTTVNCLAVGVNEEYLLTRFARTMTIQQSLKELAKSYPHAKLVDYNEIANCASFIVSPMSSGLSGQSICLNHGL